MPVNWIEDAFTEPVVSVPPDPKLIVPRGAVVVCDDRGAGYRNGAAVGDVERPAAAVADEEVARSPRRAGAVHCDRRRRAAAVADPAVVGSVDVPPLVMFSVPLPK